MGKRRAPNLPPRLIELLAGEITKAHAGEVRMSVATDRRLAQALRPHEAVLARALCREAGIGPDGTVRLAVPRGLDFADAHLDPRAMTVGVTYDPRSGRWLSDIAAGQAGFDHLCAHVWRVQGRKRDRMAACDLLALVGAAYLALLSEGAAL